MDTVKLKNKIESPKEPVGWLNTELPEFVMIRLKDYIETAKKDPINLNSTLAGNISESLSLEDTDNWFYQTVLIPLINAFSEAFPLYTNQMSIVSDDAPYCLDSFWVNFQKENEFNPPHNHTGIWSFVIWVQIPTDWREQHALPISANSNSAKASNFEFHFMDMMGGFANYPFLLDKESEGRMLFFPAKLMHSVNPFYNCDKERISISGNIFFDISEDTMKQFRLRNKK